MSHAPSESGDAEIAVESWPSSLPAGLTPVVIDAARRGDRQAAEICMAEARVYLKGLATRLNRADRARGEDSDAVQEALLGFLDGEGFAQFHGHTALEFIAFIRRLFLNRNIDRFRRLGAQKRDPGAVVPLDAAPSDGSPAVDVAASQTSPSGRAMRREEIERFLDAFLKIDDPEIQEILNWYYPGGLTFEEIAEIIGRSRGYVSNKHALGLRKLRRLLDTDRGSGV